MMSLETNSVDIDKQLSMLEKFIAELPEKAWNLGIRVLFAAAIFLIGMKLIKIVRKILRKSLERAKMELGVIQFLDALTKGVLYILLVLVIAGNFGFDAASVVALVGSAGVTIGLALQGSLSNLAGGILILLLKPFRVGDYIVEDSKGNEGTVAEIGIFYTKLMTVDHKIIILPNGTLANCSMTNYTESKTRRIDLLVGISYQASIQKAKAVLEQIASDDEGVLRQEPITVFVDSLGASEVVIGLRCFCENARYWEVRWRLLEHVKLELEKAGIEIPYQQICIHTEEK